MQIWKTVLIALGMGSAMVAGAWGVSNPAGLMEQPAGEASGPLVFEQLQLDLGRVFDDQPRTFQIPFRNEGSETIAITNVRASCGCTYARADRTDGIYAPGDRGQIEVQYNPTGRRGNQHISVTVHTDHPSQPQTIIRVQANVTPRISIEPRVVQFGPVQRGQQKVQELKVTAYADDFEAEFATVSTPESVSVRILETREVEVDGEGAREATIELTLDAGKADLGRLAGTVLLRTGRRLRLVGANYVAEVVGDLRVVPARPALGLLDPGQPFNASFKLISRTDTPFHILSVTHRSNAEDLTFEFTPENPEHPTSYEVRFVGAAPRGLSSRVILRGNVVVETDSADPAERIVEVPFYGTVKPDTGGS